MSEPRVSPVQIEELRRALQEVWPDPEAIAVIAPPDAIDDVPAYRVENALSHLREVPLLLRREMRCLYLSGKSLRRRGKEAAADTAGRLSLLAEWRKVMREFCRDEAAVEELFDPEIVTYFDDEDIQHKIDLYEEWIDRIRAWVLDLCELDESLDPREASRDALRARMDARRAKRQKKLRARDKDAGPAERAAAEREAERAKRAAEEAGQRAARESERPPAARRDQAESGAAWEARRAARRMQRAARLSENEAWIEERGKAAEALVAQLEREDARVGGR
jgi:hypothetical protein